MEMKISTKKEEPLLSRTTVEGFIGFESSTPKRAEVRKKVSEAMKVPEERVAVIDIQTVFGEKKANFKANVYASSSDLGKLESVVVQRRLGLLGKKVKVPKESKK